RVALRVGERVARRHCAGLARCKPVGAAQRARRGRADDRAPAARAAGAALASSLASSSLVQHEFRHVPLAPLSWLTTGLSIGASREPGSRPVPRAHAIVMGVPGLVVSSAALPIDIRPFLGPDVALRIPAHGSQPRAALLAELAGASALVSLLDVRVDEELLAAAPRLRVVANCAVGYDNIDVAAATRRGVVVTNTPDVLTDATADFTFALLLAAARRLVEGDGLVRNGAWKGWAIDLLLGADVSGRTLGI